MYSWNWLRIAHIPTGDDRLTTAINPATANAVTMVALVAIWEFFTFAGVAAIFDSSITVSFSTTIHCYGFNNFLLVIYNS